MTDKVELKCEGCAGSKKKSSTVVQMCGDLAADLFSGLRRREEKNKLLLPGQGLEHGTVSSQAHRLVHHTVEVLLPS